jgi:hypothetical protein
MWRASQCLSSGDGEGRESVEVWGFILIVPGDSGLQAEEGYGFVS